MKDMNEEKDTKEQTPQSPKAAAEAPSPESAPKDGGKKDVAAGKNAVGRNAAGQNASGQNAVGKNAAKWDSAKAAKSDGRNAAKKDGAKAGKGDGAKKPQPSGADGADGATAQNRETAEAAPGRETPPGKEAASGPEASGAEKELAALKDQFLRLGAEYDNYRKRTVREKENLWQDAKIDTIQKFLPIYDNLERAASAQGDDDNPHKKGLVMIFQQFREALKAMGVTEIDAAGKPFDPEKHNAVMHIDDENLGENTVAQVFQTGFQLGDKVIRHAFVQVAN